MSEHVLRAVTEATQAVHLQSDLSEALAEIVSQTQRCLPEFDHISLSRVGRDRRMEALAATSDLARAFDALQSAADEGPCMDAILEDEVVVVPDAQHEQRWLAYIPKALGVGLRSQLGVRIPGHDQTLLGLNLYSTTHEDIDPGSIGVAEHFAVHAGLALGRLHQEEQLRTAIGTRTTIGTALGILMERYTLTQADAFAYLLRQSSTQNRKVRVVAGDLVREAEQRTHPV